MESFKKDRLINIAFYLIVISGLFLFLMNNKSDLSLQILFNELIVLIIFFKLTNFILFNQLYFEIFKFYNLKISKSENFELTYKGYIGNFFGFGKSGTGYKAIKLKNNFNFSYLKFASFYIFLQTLSLFITSLICLLVIIFFDHILINEEKVLQLLLVFVLLSCIFANYIFRILSRIPLLSKKKFFHNIILSLREIGSIFNQLQLQNKQMLKILFLQFLIQVNLFLQIFFQAKILSFEISLLSNFVYNIISQLAIFISVTPNSIGIKEFLLVISNRFIGLGSTQVFDIAIVDRITDFLSLIIFSFIYKSIKNLYNRS